MKKYYLVVKIASDKIVYFTDNQQDTKLASNETDAIAVYEGDLPVGMTLDNCETFIMRNKQISAISIVSAAILNPSDYVFNSLLQKDYLEIAKEAIGLYKRDMFDMHLKKLENVVKPADEIKTFNLLTNTYQVMLNMCPFTWTLISKINEIINCKQKNIHFSSTPANNAFLPSFTYNKEDRIVTHRLCVYSDRLENDNTFYFKVDNQRRALVEGKVVTFDASYPNEVKNKGSNVRIELVYNSPMI